MAVLGAFFLFLVMSISAETIALVALPVIILGIIIYCLSLIWDFIITYPILISFVAVLTLPVLYFISEKYNNNSNYCHIKNDNKNVLFDEKKALENKFDEIFKYHILLQIVSDFNDSGYLKHNSPTYKFFFDSDILSHYPEFEKNLIKTQWYDVSFYLINKNHMIEFLNICFSSNEYIFLKYNTNWEKMNSTIWKWYQKNFKITVPVSDSNLDKYLKNNEDFLKINFPYFDIKLKIDKAPLDLFDVIQNWKKNNQVL